jgi:transcriptional regulator with XRE-family HTH domain
VPRRRQPRKALPAPFPTLEPFARRLEGLRLDRGLTQRALAARAHISTNYYHDIAHAQANPTVIVLLSLADALDVPVSDLFDCPEPVNATRRVVSAADLRDLAATHQHLTHIVERLAR